MSVNAGTLVIEVRTSLRAQSISPLVFTARGANTENGDHSSGRRRVHPPGRIPEFRFVGQRDNLSAVSDNSGHA